MSSASVTSSKRDKELIDEVESIRALNNSLRAYLQHLRMFKKNLASMNNNCQQLSKVNTQWIETLNIMKR